MTTNQEMSLRELSAKWRGRADRIEKIESSTPITRAILLERANRLRADADELAAVAPEGMDGWQPIAEAVLLPRGSDGCTGPCAVLLKIDTGRPGPFIRQGRFDVCAGGFICDSTGQVLRDAIAFIRPKFGMPPATAGEE